jgi:hypothetical protein
MSRVSCPKCGAKLAATTSLRESNWFENNYGRGQKPRYDHAAAIQMFKEGMSMGAIGIKFGVSASAVREMLIRNGAKDIRGNDPVPDQDLANSNSLQNDPDTDRGMK